MFITIEMDSVPGLRQYLLHFVVVVAYVNVPEKLPSIDVDAHTHLV